MNFGSVNRIHRLNLGYQSLVPYICTRVLTFSGDTSHGYSVSLRSIIITCFNLKT